METTNIIHIKNPSPELVAFIEKAQDRKRVRMQPLSYTHQTLPTILLV